MLNALIVALPLIAALPNRGGTLYDFTLNAIDGKSTPLAEFKGKVALIVNVASKCGNTPQYEGLEALYEKRKDQGFTILAFPANEFRGQEPGSNKEISEFCKATYGVTFPLFEKIVVKGDGIHPLYQWLIENGPRHDEIEWNFAKFLVGRDGRILARFTPKTTPEDPALIEAIDKALATE